MPGAFFSQVPTAHVHKNLSPMARYTPWSQQAGLYAHRHLAPAFKLGKHKIVWLPKGEIQEDGTTRQHTLPRILASPTNRSPVHQSARRESLLPILSPCTKRLMRARPSRCSSRAVRGAFRLFGRIYDRLVFKTPGAWRACPTKGAYKLGIYLLSPPRPLGFKAPSTHQILWPVRIRCGISVNIRSSEGEKRFCLSKSRSTQSS